MTQLNGKIALVTGGTKGIGKAIAEKLSNAGAEVAVTARNAPLDNISGHHFIAADATNPESAAKVAQEIVGKFGKIDIIVNNAGANINPRGGYSTLSDEDCNNELQLNLMAAVRINKALLPKMISQKNGVIINISTIAAQQPIGNMTMSYSASKAALNAYSKALASEVGTKGIRVNVVSPGLVKTPLMEEFIENMAKTSNISFDEAFKNLMDTFNTPLGRMAEPEEVANMVSFLVSPEAEYLTGTNYQVDGGLMSAI